MQLSRQAAAMLEAGRRRRPRGTFALAGLAGLALLATAGCSRPPASPAPPARPSAPQPPSAATISRLTRLGQAPAGGWWGLAGKWYGAWQQAPTPGADRTGPAAAGRARPVVAVDLRTVASHHPAWQLANFLSRGDSVEVPVAPRGSAERGLDELQVPEISTVAGRSAAPDPSRPASTSQKVPASPWLVDELPRLEEDARADQESALEVFLNRSDRRREETRAALRAMMQERLEQELLVLERESPDMIEPAQPPDPLQLEMTNLRLRLLPAVEATAAEREAARARLRELEAAWEARLREQEASLLAELDRLRRLVPAERRRAGEERLANRVAALERAHLRARETLRQAQHALRAADFGPDQARFGIVLPEVAGGRPVFRSLSYLPEPAPPVRLAPWPQVIFEPRRPVLASARMEVPSPATADQLARLRALALNDARRWIRIAVRRGGWQWAEDMPAFRRPARAPDHTARVMAILNLS